MIDLNAIPENSGCYLFKNGEGRVVYVGKAKCLQKRVKSYFQKRGHDEKTLALMRNVADVDLVVTDSEVEALILENTLIKKHRPKYNLDLKESQRYAYVRVTDELFPRLLTARQKTEGGKFFGPFTSGTERHYVIESLNRSFKLRTCKRLPKKACLRYGIGLCSAPCVGAVSREEYAESVVQASDVLRGKTDKIISDLKVEMKKHSDELRYEHALGLRDKISAIRSLREKQKMQRQRKYDEDIINYAIKDGKVYLLLFNVYKGTLANKQEFVFDKKAGFLDEFMIQYYSSNDVPKEVVLPLAVDPSIGLFLEKKRGGKAILTVPKVGDKKKLLSLAKKNIELSFFKETRKLESLKNALKLNDVPAVIECFDVSHLSGTSTVGSMVQFRYSKPDKSNYRRFKIRTVEGIDDFKAMSEVVSRRYARLRDECRPMPNLVLIDGGRGQLNAAINQLKALGIRLPVIGLAKRLEEIYVPGLAKPLRLGRKEESLKLLQQIRDEAHRFAISYNRLLRKKRMLK